MSLTVDRIAAMFVFGMKEIQDIVRAFGRMKREGTPCALATVVRAQGSTYRRPGARMLFSENGRVAGLINASCFEADLAERAKEVISSGEPRLVRYDTTSSADIVFGLGLGCNGIVEVLLEPGDAQSTGKKLDLLRACIDNRYPLTLATVVGGGSSDRARLGDFLAVRGGQRVEATIGDARLLSQIEADAKGTASPSSTLKTFASSAEKVEIFFELISPPLPLVIFGAGADAIPLVEAAKSLGWHVTVVDHRAAYASRSNFPAADSLLVAEDIPTGLDLDEGHAAVIMTHNFTRDRNLLRTLLVSPARYVGLLGPRSKLQTILQSLGEQGFTPGEDHLRKLHAPIGLDIGAETPEEIAISIVAEIKAVLENRSGGFLKDRRGAIH